jgi:hypothetical protein
MADYVTFVRGKEDAQIASSEYKDTAAYWLSGRTAPKLRPMLPPSGKIWIDASIDGLRNWPNISDDNYREYISKFIHHERIGEPAFQRKPDAKLVSAFVQAVLSHIVSCAPDSTWLSVPQLPYDEERKQNVINKSLAKATREWVANGKFRGRLVLPVILTNQRQLNKKVQRNVQIQLAAQCFSLSGAEGVWAVDSSLNDQAGTGNLEHERFPGIVRFHEELNNKLGKECFTIAGPYWGMNLILWTRQLVQHPAITVGKAYQYYVPGNQFSSASVRVALPGLRRMALCSPELKSWLQESAANIGQENPLSEEFKKLEKQTSAFLTNEQLARKQVSASYREWLAKLESIPREGRAVALYQDFSSAYVLGKALPDLKGPEAAKNPSRIAKQFMNNCL